MKWRERETFDYTDDVWISPNYRKTGVIMETKNSRKWENFRMWLIIVIFLLVFPPGLPLALLTDNPIIGGCIAVGFATIFGSLVWLISLYATDNERIKGWDEREK